MAPNPHSICYRSRLHRVVYLLSGPSELSPFIYCGRNAASSTPPYSRGYRKFIAFPVSVKLFLCSKADSNFLLSL